MSEQQCALKAARYEGYRDARSGVDDGFMMLGGKELCFSSQIEEDLECPDSEYYFCIYFNRSMLIDLSEDSTVEPSRPCS